MSLLNDVMGAGSSIAGIADKLSGKKKGLVSNDNRRGKLNEFISSVNKYSIAVTNQYELQLIFPPALSNSFFKNKKGSRANRLLPLYCKSVDLPDMNIATTPYKLFGEERETPTHRTFGNLTATFYVDSNLEVKQLFEAWVGMVIDPVNRTVQYRDNYVSSSSTLMILNKDMGNGKDYYSDGDLVYSVEFEELYPKTINAIPMTYQGSAAMELTVQFAYKSWSGARMETIDLTSQRRVESGLYDAQLSFKERMAQGINSVNNAINTFDTINSNLNQIGNLMNQGLGGAGALLSMAENGMQPDGMLGGLFGGASKWTGTNESDAKFADSITKNE